MLWVCGGWGDLILRLSYNTPAAPDPVEIMLWPLTAGALALDLAPRGVLPYIRQHFLDKTFQGLYQINAFDLGLLIPYFVVLIILAAYGAHRYWLVYLYYKNRAKKTTEPAADFPDLPRGTVQ